VIFIFMKKCTRCAHPTFRLTINLGGCIYLGKPPRFEAAFEGVKVGFRFEEFGEDGLDELFFVGYAEGAAGGEPGYGVWGRALVKRGVNTTCG
jgi:hypothetical protein